jgi:hypothetical protein
MRPALGADMHIDPTHLERIRGTTLFYPCCGRDLGVPIQLFGSVVSAFYFVDVAGPRHRRAQDDGLIPLVRGRSAGPRRYRHRTSGSEFELHLLQKRGEEVFPDIPNLGVFFHRGDTLADGEGSSGVPWLGGAWLVTIFRTLVPGGLLVTDGSNCPVDGPPELRAFHGDRTLGPRAARKARPFEFAGRRLACVGYAGERYGPTLVWRVD